MAGPFVVSMQFKADTAQAKAALSDLRGGVDGVSTAADKARGATAAEARELDALATAADKARRATATEAKELDALATAAATAALHQSDLAAKMRQAQIAVVPDGIAGQFDAAIAAATGLGRAGPTALLSCATAADRMRDAVGALPPILASVGREGAAAVAETRAWQSALDEVRASFNPLFAASRQYEAELERIAEAERLGAISAREAADARQRAAARMAPVAPGQARPGGMGAGSPFVTADLAAQGNDIIMMAAAGQNPLQLALQQGTQVSQRLNMLEKGTSIPKTLAAGFMSMVNPVSLATIGIIGLGAFGLQSLGKLIPPTKTLADTVSGLEKAVSDYEQAMNKVRRTDFAADFGRSAAAARQLAGQMAEVKRLAAEIAAADAMKAAGQSVNLDFWRDWNPVARAKPQQLFGIGRFDAEGSRAAFAAAAAANEASAAKGIDAQIAALQKLIPLWKTAMELRGGVTKDEADGLTQYATALDGLLRQKALDENAAGKAQARDMSVQLERQAALQGVIARFGQDSADVRALELTQAKMAAAEKLRGLGIDLRSTDARRVMAAIDADADARATAEATRRQNDQDDQLAAIAREQSLLGATAAERARINALAEAEIAIRDRNLKGQDAELERARALARARAEAGLAADQAQRDRDHARVMAGYDIAVGEARDPVGKAAIEAQREYARVMQDTNDVIAAQDAASLARARSLAEALAGTRQNILALSDELAARRAVEAEIAAGRAPREDAARLMQLELELRPLIAAAAQAEGIEKEKLTAVILGLRIASEAAAADQRRVAGNDLIRSQAERLAQLRLEQALLGRSAELRTRILALAEAEQEIRRTGVTGDAAEEIRRQARAQAELATQVERQADAWGKVREAGESALDTIFDKGLKGDFKGMLADLAGEASKMVLELGVKNPLKNALLGANLGTLDDIGGFKGILGRLLGGADEAALTRQAMAPVAAMTIAATQVTINAASLAGLTGPAANLPFGPMAANAGGAPNGPVSGTSLSLLQAVATGGGARTGAIAGLDAALAEPLAAMVAEAQGLFGQSAVKVTSAYRSFERQQQLWNEALAKYGSADAARKWVAPPGRSNHNQGLAADLGYGSPEVRDWFHKNAGRFGLGFRMANEPWHIEPRKTGGAQQAMVELGTAAQVATGQVGILSTGMTAAGSAAQAAGSQITGTAPSVAQLGTSAQTASAGVGKLGQGLGQFGGQLQGILGAVASGNKGGAAAGLLGLGFDLLTKGLGGGGAAPAGYAAGGYTGAGQRHEVAGVVHAGEYVFDAGATSRIGVGALEAIRSGRFRGFADGGYVGAAPAVPAVTRAPRVPSAEAGSRAAGGEGMVLTVSVEGARGNAEIMEMVRKGVEAGLRENNRSLGGQVARVAADPRMRYS